MTDHAGRPWAQAAMPGPWADRALCIGKGDVFFPPTGRMEHAAERIRRIRTALAICNVCPVREQCLEFATTNKEHHGIWGGVVLDKSRRARDVRLQRERNVA